MNICTHASVVVRGVSPDAVFDYATSAEAASEFFQGFGPIPAIRKIEFLPGSGPRVGGRRQVLLADGTALEEEILELQPPARHSYRVSGFRPPLSLLAKSGKGTWDFSSRPEGTGITWHYAYHLASPLAWPLGAVLVKLFMRGAMRRALGRIAARFEGRT